MRGNLQGKNVGTCITTITKYVIVGILVVCHHLSVTAQPFQPQFELEFVPSNIDLGETSTLKYTLTNPNNSINFSALGFVDDLPPGLVIAPTPNTSSSCTYMTITAVAGGNTITFVDGQLPAMTSCMIQVDVVAENEGVFENSAELSTGRDPVKSNEAILGVGINLDVTLEDTVIYDPSMDMIANPDDSIRYKLTIENQGNGSVNNLLIKGGSDPNTTIDPSTIRATPLAINDEYQLMTVSLNIPATMGVLANDADVNDPLPNPPFNENLTVLSVQGGPPGSPQSTENGGTVTVTADGGITYDSTNVFTAISDSFYYKIIDTEGFIDSARVVIFWTRPPIAQDDFFDALVNVANAYQADTLFADNGNGVDDPGIPTGVIGSFGGGSLGGSVIDHVSGSSVPFAGGMLTVNSDGSFSLTNPTMTGIYTFLYRIENLVGFSDATVTISVNEGPTAQPDQYSFLYTTNQNVNAGAGLFADNGSGPDDLAFPAATLISYGGGDLGGTVGDHAAGGSASLAGGSLTVNADGSWSLTGQPFTPGTYTFDYRIGNVADTSAATVTLVIQDPPIAQNDLLTAQVNMMTNYMMGTLFANNGAGADHLGIPVSTITSFGGGDITGSTDVTDFAAGATTAAGTFAGGTLTVNADGSFTITNPTSTGDFTFIYRIENAAGHSDAVVTIDILGPPNGQNDSAPTVLDGTSNPGDNDFHIMINGSSIGIINVFDDNGFGADDLGNPFAINDMNPDVIQSVNLAGVSDAGTGTIGGASFAIGGSGSLEITSTGILNFTPPTNFTGIVTFEYILANSIGADATPDMVTLAVGERPAAVADNYSAVGNIPINSTNLAGSSVLGNDEGDNISVVDVQGNVMNVGISTMTSQGGSVTMGADGEFEYIPATGFTGDDTFTYSVDNGFGSPSQTTVTISVVDIIYFMDDMAAAGGDGSLNAPFQSISEHNAAMMPNGSYLFVKDNGNSYSGNLTLINGETVIGEGTTGSLFGMSSLTNIVLPPLSSTVGYATTGIVADWVEISNNSGNGITLHQNNTLSGLVLGNTVGYGIADNGATVGNLLISQTTITGTGGGISIFNGGAINVTLNELNSTGNYYGIRLRNVTGVGMQIPGNVNIDNTGGSSDLISLQNVDASNVNIGTDAGSTVTLTNQNTNDAIEITTSGSAILFGSTTITNSTTGNGVNIHNNSGDVSFINGGMHITTSSGTGIYANNNTGSLTVTGSGNKLTSSSGTTLNIINSLIGSDDLNFESITAAAGSAPAIVLNTTGTAGGLNVTGDNMNTALGGNASGGTIGGRTGTDGSTSSGIGIYLNNTSHINLQRMSLNGTFQNFGLRGNNVANFSLEYCSFTGTYGTNAVEDEGVVSFTGLTGMALVRSSSLTGGQADIIRIENTAGSLDSLIVENSFIGLNSTSMGKNGILVQTLNNAVVKMRVSDTEFAGAREDCMQVNALGNSTAGVKILRCDFTNAHSNIVVGGGGITLSGGNNMSNITYDYVVDDCDFSGSEGYSITANFSSNQGMVTGIISNNTISNTISGIVAGGEKVGGGGADLIHKVLISDNIITGVYGGNGIRVSANRGPNAASRAETYATVINNSVTGMTGEGFTALRILVGGSATSGDFAFVCADVRNNVFDASGPTFASNAIIADQISTDSRFNFPQYMGSVDGEFGPCGTGTASAGMSAYMTGRGNMLTNGPVPGYPGGGVNASLACNILGSGTNCE